MLKMILATGLNGELGQNNQLLIHIPEDLKHFKKVTEGKVVVMGRKTAESLPNGKPLPNRVNIVMTRQPYENGCEGFLRCNDYKKILKIAESEDVFIIGGAEIYKLFEYYVEEVYWTTIHKFFPNADTYYDMVGLLDKLELAHLRGYLYDDVEYFIHKLVKVKGGR